MEKVVRKFSDFASADEADEERYRQMSGDEKLVLLLDLLMPDSPDEAVIERSARVYPLGSVSKEPRRDATPRLGSLAVTLLNQNR